METLKFILFSIFEKYDGKIDTFWPYYKFEAPHYKGVRFTEKGLEIDGLDKSSFTAEQWKQLERVDKRKATIKWNKIHPNFSFFSNDNETVITIEYEYYDSDVKRSIDVNMEITLTKKELP